MILPLDPPHPAARARLTTALVFPPDSGGRLIREVHPGVILHFDAANRIVEIEILSASKVLAAGALDNLTTNRTP